MEETAPCRGRSLLEFMDKLQVMEQGKYSIIVFQSIHARDIVVVGKIKSRLQKAAVSDKRLIYCDTEYKRHSPGTPFSA
jgi:hypothetical protein